MAHFLPKETLPAASHVLASLQPRGTHGATGRGERAGKNVWFGCLHFHAMLNSLDVMQQQVAVTPTGTHAH